MVQFLHGLEWEQTGREGVGEGQLSIAQGVQRDLPIPGPGVVFQASGFSSGAAPGMAYCGEGGLGD